jgi:hypothetical protein
MVMWHNRWRPPGLRLGQAYVHAIADRYQCSDYQRASLLTDEAQGRVRGGDTDDERYDRTVLLSWASIYLRVDSLEAALRASEQAVRLFSTLP